MNGRLLRCHCASAPHVPTTYAAGRFSRRRASGAFLNRLHDATSRTGT